MPAFGSFNAENLRRIDLASGISTEFGTLIPPGARVAGYVRSTGLQDGDDEDVKRRLFLTLDAALGQCRSGLGDVVFVMPGHVESVSTANFLSHLVAGAKIIGLGDGNLRPTFTWTTATSTVLLNVANVAIHNCILKLEPGAGTVTVAAPITVSAAGCSITNCRIMFGTDATNLVTIGITTTAAGDDLLLANLECFGATAAECTTFLQCVGADRLKILNCRITGATSSTGVGLIRFLTTASLDVSVDQLMVRNNKAASIVAITGMAGVTGVMDNVLMVTLANDNLTNCFGTSLGSLSFGANCKVSNNVTEAAGQFGVVSA